MIKSNRLVYDFSMLSMPEDYGLSPERTLAHEAEDDRPADFDAYWTETREAVETISPTWRGTLDGPVVQVTFESWRAVRVVAWLTTPKDEMRGAVITTHGAGAADVFPSEPEPWAEHGLLTMRLRVRGYPPSVEDTGDLRADWILHGIEFPETWIVRGAVVDIIQAYRCLRRRYGPELPISIHGESLGGGLAVMAAAQLAAMGDPPLRLAIGLPSLGDWRWRAGRYCNGMGGQVTEWLSTMRAEAEAAVERMRYCDAALHARDVAVPALAKLARHDDVVPAPAAAAVFNALAGRKWRQVTDFGHFDGGLADLRRHAEFERLHPRFVDPAASPEALIEAESMAPIEAGADQKSATDHPIRGRHPDRM